MSIRKALCSVMFCMLCAIAAPANAAQPKPAQILFVGNSLTYVGNLPAVFTALAASNGQAATADMLVKGGATLTQWLDGGAVQHALAARHYDYVVLQERGNDFACGFGPQVCKDSRHALQVLSGIVRGAGAKPILMGTYQVSRGASQKLLVAEAKAARDNAMPYIAVSGRLNAGRKQYPYFNWFAKAGHPGHDLVLLEAVLLYKQLYGALPKSQELHVRAPMFVPGNQFAAPDPVSLPLRPDVPLAGGYDYSQAEMASALELAH